MPYSYGISPTNIILSSGDVVLALNRPIIQKKLKIAKIPSDIPISILYQRAGKIVSKNTLKSNEAFYFLEKNIFNFTQKTAIGSDQPFISSSLLNKWRINLPKDEEIVKIDFVLDCVDKLISLQQRKLEQLKLLKRSLLQNLFTDKNIPKLRFKDFSDVWDQRKLGECLNINSGKDYKHLKQGNIPVYGTGGYMLSVDGVLSKKDAVGIGRKGTIDHPQLLKAPFWTVDTLFFAIPKRNYDLYFIYSIFQKIKWKRYDESTGLPSLTKTTIKNIQVNIASLNEQKKIGKILKLIEHAKFLQQKKILKLQQIKQFLLQNMFI